MFERVAVPASINPDSLSGFNNRYTVALSNDQCQVIHLTGDAKAFCTGMDLNYVADAYERDFIGRFAATLRMVRHSSKPVVAMVEGDVIAGGMALLSVADLVVAIESATFQLPEASFGLAPTIAMACLRERIALGDLKTLAWTSQRVSARRALEIGLVDHVCAQDTLDRDVQGISRELARIPAEVIRASRTLLGVDGSFDEVLGVGCDLLRRRLEEPGVMDRVRCYRDGVMLVNGKGASN